jgi:hypothetical protein
VVTNGASSRASKTQMVTTDVLHILINCITIKPIYFAIVPMVPKPQRMEKMKYCTKEKNSINFRINIFVNIISKIILNYISESICKKISHAACKGKGEMHTKIQL